MKTIYKDYFQIDENYFPCVNESAINAGLKWNEFYPHATFIKLLKDTERMLSRSTNRSIWISGAYGTGKSYAAFALSQLLTASNKVVENYFNNYEALHPHKIDLMQKLISAKNEGPIITCYKYASSSINSSNDLIVMLQEIIANSVKKAGLKYTGADTLKNGILAWLEDDRNRQLFKGYAEKEYSDLFGGWSTEEIIEKLIKLENTSDLVSKISKMAGEIGITALKMDMDDLIAYIKDIINGNKLKALVCVLDEFSEFFQNNRHSLTDFQKLVETCAEMPFYLIVVAHNITTYFNEKDEAGRKTIDRFVTSNISMPDNIAFFLLKEALRVKPEAEKDWEEKLDDLQDYTKKSRKAVSELTKIDDGTLKGVLPLHPMAALLLKNIASAFESDQRSMFDFIKNDGNYKAFQWFIENHGPLDEGSSLLTVDMLWDFFYESGKEKLAVRIRNILDTYKRAEAHKLFEEEERVLKAILIMQAVSTHLNDEVSLFVTTSQNLQLCFEGTDYEYKASAIAEKLTRQEVIYKKPIGDNKYCYVAAVMPGDAVAIDKKKKEIINDLDASNLCIDEMTRAFSLTSSLKMRYESLIFSTNNRITIDTNRIINQGNPNDFYALVCVAKDDNEAFTLRKRIQEKVMDSALDNRNIIFIDATPTPLGADSISQYADYMAGYEILRGKDNAAADDMLRKGKDELGKWGARIYNGDLILYSRNNQSGKRYSSWQQALRGLRDFVLEKHQNAFEFSQGLTEITLRPSSAQQWVEAGIIGRTVGQFVSAEKIVEGARKKGEYWISDPYSPLSIIKNSIDKEIQNELEANSKISIMNIIYLLREKHGFVPSHLYVFLTGFLLKEYANEAFHYSDESRNEKMNPNLMKGIVDEAYKQLYAPSSRYKDKYIRIMSQHEQIFCQLISDVFEIPESQCGSVEDVIKRVRIREKTKGLPAWVLIEKAVGTELEFINKFVDLLNPARNTNISTISGAIGSIAEKDDKLAQKLKVLITDNSRRESMKSYLAVFDDGVLLSLAKEIGAEERVINDIQSYFGDDTEGIWLWNKETGEGQIRKVIRDYKFVKISNELLHRKSSSVNDSLTAWQEKFKFLKLSHEVVREAPPYAPFTAVLYQIARGATKEYIKDFYDTLVVYGEKIIDLLRRDKEVFAQTCAHYLEGLSEQEVSEIYKNIPNGCFINNKQEYYQKIQQIVEDYKRNLDKTKLHKLWQEKTETLSPYAWSMRYGTPILSCVPADKWNEYKRAFGAVNRQNPEDAEVKFALEFLTTSTIWSILNSQEKIDIAFINSVLYSFKAVLTDLNEVRRYLKKNTQINPYDWANHPEIQNKVAELARSKYHEEPYNRVVSHIDRMDGEKLKTYLKRLVKNNMIVGIEILEDSEEK